MSITLVSVGVISLLGLTAIGVYWLVTTRNWRLFVLMLGIVGAGAFFLTEESLVALGAPRARGSRDSSQDVYVVIVLFMCMLLGMLAQYGFKRFEGSRETRQPVDWANLLAPVFASPIVFVPLLGALQNADIDLRRLDAVRIMVFFVAFENGFFWKDYFDHRRRDKFQRGP